jgi:hypothetical protein
MWLALEQNDLYFGGLLIWVFFLLLLVMHNKLSEKFNLISEVSANCAISQNKARRKHRTDTRCSKLQRGTLTPNEILFLPPSFPFFLSSHFGGSGLSTLFHN